jgi:hypothetical protein
MTVSPCEFQNLIKELYVMFELPIEEYEWKESASGNFVAIGGTGNHEATVFSKDFEWQIIINGEDAVGRFVAEEAFDDSEDAMERTEEILRGADCTLVLIKPKDETTNWRQQRSTSNGSPTYGRKHQGVGVSVKKASSGSWYHNVHGSAPQGWYVSAEEAMQAFDAQHD